MTPIMLLDEIAIECKEATRDLLLPCRGDKDKPDSFRTPNIYKMNVPRKEDNLKQIPYVVAQVLSGEDDQPFGDTAESECGIRIVIAVYSEDMSEGPLNVLNVITRIRERFLLRKSIDGQFLLKRKISWAIDPRPEDPYYFGEMIMTFEMPPIYPDCDGIEY